MGDCQLVARRGTLLMELGSLRDFRGGGGGNFFHVLENPFIVQRWWGHVNPTTKGANGIKKGHKKVVASWVQKFANVTKGVKGCNVPEGKVQRPQRQGAKVRKGTKGAKTGCHPVHPSHICTLCKILK